MSVSEDAVVAFIFWCIFYYLKLFTFLFNLFYKQESRLHRQQKRNFLFFQTTLGDPPPLSSASCFRSPAPSFLPLACLLSSISCRLHSVTCISPPVLSPESGLLPLPPDPFSCSLISIACLLLPAFCFLSPASSSLLLRPVSCPCSLTSVHRLFLPLQYPNYGFNYIFPSFENASRFLFPVAFLLPMESGGTVTPLVQSVREHIVRSPHWR